MLRRSSSLVIFIVLATAPATTPVHAAASPIFLGVGHLRHRRDPDYQPSDWQREVRFPFFAGPGGPLRGWVAEGRVMGSTPADGAVRPVIAAMTETAYEEVSFVVLEARDDGWLRVRVRPPGAGRDEAGWVHRCQLPPQLVYEPWEELLLGGNISPLFFRTAVPHALRASPGADSERLAWIPSENSDYELEPLELEGDWVRVRLKIPSEYCRAPGEVTPRVWEGWVKWWGSDIGPWLWFYTRGC